MMPCTLTLPLLYKWEEGETPYPHPPFYRLSVWQKKRALGSRVTL